MESSISGAEGAIVSLRRDRHHCTRLCIKRRGNGPLPGRQGLMKIAAKKLFLALYEGANPHLKAPAVLEAGENEKGTKEEKRRGG